MMYKITEKLILSENYIKNIYKIENNNGTVTINSDKYEEEVISDCTNNIINKILSIQQQLLNPVDKSEGKT